MSIEDYRNRREKFWSQVDLAEGDVSVIWSELRKDFQDSNKWTLRTYGLSPFPYTKVQSYRNVTRFVSFPFKLISRVSNSVRKKLLRVLSWAFFEFDSRAAMNFGFDYDFSVYDPKLLDQFQLTYAKYGIGISYNTLKSFSYLEQLKSRCNLNLSMNVLEIGAGVFNFGHLLSLQLESMNYVICDLPEMIATSHKEITESYISNCGGDYEVFLPNEIENFMASVCERKILFITPKQFHSGILKKKLSFDLFVNHESFGEMDITTVNEYLIAVAEVMKSDGIVNLVNRHSRPQAKSKSDFENLTINKLTNFDDYDLGFCTPVMYDIDSFRSRFPGPCAMPNIYYIGRVKT